jgi:membrane-associated phospholipid phosphatase
METLLKARSYRFRIGAALVCYFLLPSAHLRAQDSTPDSASVSPLILQDVKLGLEDASSFFTAPLHFSDNEWLRSAAFIGGTAALFTLDDRIQRDLSNQGRKSLNGDIWDVPTVYGSAYFAVGLSLATYAAGLAGENEELRTTGRLLGESLVLAGVPSTVVKIVAGRRRPYAGEGPWKFHAFQLSDGSQSFPSGHATVAFAVSTVLAERIDNTWARIGLYGLASLTALARVHNNQHWFSDVVGGAGLGITSGLYVVSAEKQRASRPHQTERRFMIFPSRYGLTFSYRFN